MALLNQFPKKPSSDSLTDDDFANKIKKLQQQIALARDIANRIKVGVQFYRNTTLELRNPPNMQDLSTSTQISGYFRTKEKNGLLLYLGNEVGTNLRRTKTVSVEGVEL